MGRKFLAEAQSSQRKLKKHSGQKPRLKDFDLTLPPPRLCEGLGFSIVLTGFICVNPRPTAVFRFNESATLTVAEFPGHGKENTGAGKGGRRNGGGLPPGAARDIRADID